MVQSNASEQSQTISNSSTNPAPETHTEIAPRRDIVQHLKDLDEQAKLNDPERQAKIERGKKKRTYGFGRFAMFLVGSGNN